MASKSKPFVMFAHAEGYTVGFGLHKGKAWIQISSPLIPVISTLSEFHRETVVLSAAMLIDSDLWPAFVSHLKPENTSDTLF